MARQESLTRSFPGSTQAFMCGASFLKTIAPLTGRDGSASNNFGRQVSALWRIRLETRLDMKQRITLITLGVDDLEKSLRFYRDGLGFPTEGSIGQEFEHGAVVFIELESGLRLALWPRKSIAHDSGLLLGKR